MSFPRERLTERINEGEINRTLAGLSQTVVATYQKPIQAGELALIGIQTRGATIARRMSEWIKKENNFQIPVATLGITLYRDDIELSGAGSPKIIKPTEIAISLDRKTVVLVDDVLFTGRTIRAALQEILDYGRPDRVVLLVMVNRTLGRQLPIQADHFGYSDATEPAKKVLVRLRENDPGINDGIYVEK